MSATNIYVDGFNLYYGGLRATPYRWLDLDALCRRVLPGHTINRIRYFAAKVTARPSDPSQPQRQGFYLRALATIPHLSIHLGHFLSNPVFMPLENPLPGGPAVVRVIKTEEKGSDVNLATWLVHDAYQADFDRAVVLSNDSDLAFPIELVVNALGRPVSVLYPQRLVQGKSGPALSPAKPAGALHRAAAGRVSAIAPADFAGCQFPPELSDASGIFRKPALWDEYVWCQACTTADGSKAWTARGRCCPSCGAIRALAWSVIRLGQPSYPIVPHRGTRYVL